MKARTGALPLIALALGLVAGPVPAAAAPIAAQPSDFNGDGYADLAVGADSLGGDTGSVTVLYGSHRGLTADGSERWSLDTPGVKGQEHRASDGDGDQFGGVLATADFDRDGYADLAVGVPGARVHGVQFAGAVNVLHGTRQGLTSDGDQRWTQRNLPGIPETRDRFGAVLAAGDFNHDGYWDLAIGVPGEVLGGGLEGIVQVLLGGPNGLTGAGSATLSTATIGSPPEASGQLGSALAAGDLDGDGASDLAVGVWDNCEPWPCGDGGSVAVVPGGPGGLTGAGASIWNQDTPGVLDEGEWRDNFGSSLAIGDFDGDGFGDLAVGAFGEGITGGPDDDAANGAVAVLYGSSAGPTADGNQRWDENTPGVPGMAKPGDRFGGALAAGDFDGDGREDLAIGAPSKGAGGKDAAGVVVVLYGSIATGLTSTGAQRWTQASPGVPSAAEQYDEFGISLSAADYGRSGRDDLAIGAPGEQVGKVWRAGMVDVLYGRTDGLSSDHAQGWSQNSPGVAGKSERFGSFGSAVTP